MNFWVSGTVQHNYFAHTNFGLQKINVFFKLSHVQILKTLNSVSILCMQGNFYQCLIFIPFTLWPIGEFNTGQKQTEY